MEKTFDGVTILDQQGQSRDEAWLRSRHGNLMLWSTGDQAGWRLVKVQEQEGPVACCVAFLNEDGTPYTPAGANFWYSTAPVTACTAHSLPAGLTQQGDTGAANNDGIVGFALSGDSWYLPPGERGPYAVWPCVGSDNDIDVLWGLGMPRNPDGSYTDHRHLNLWYRWTEEEPEPEPGEVIERLERIETTVDEIEAQLQDFRLAAAAGFRCLANELDLP